MEQTPCEPISCLCRRCHRITQCIPELWEPHDEGDIEEYDGRNDLNLEFLPNHHAQSVACPTEIGLIGEESTDEEEEWHSEKYEERQCGRNLYTFPEGLGTDMICNDENHRESSHCVEPLHSFLCCWYWCVHCFILLLSVHHCVDEVCRGLVVAYNRRTCA